MDKQLITNHGEITLPAFMPDATYGSIKSTSFLDAKKAGINEIVTTTLHLEQKVGSLYIKEMGGVHKFFGWDRPILSDSGGWQVFSLINSKRANPANQITKVGCSFVDPITGKYTLLSPESSQNIQYNLGADIVTVLDDPIIGDSPLNERKDCIEINTQWAKRAKKRFLELNELTEKTFDKVNTRTHIGCVIQGGDDFDLRKQSAEELIDIGFDIYNFGGIPLHSGITWQNNLHRGKFYREMLQYVSDLIPAEKIKYAMGVGQPEDIAFCAEVGWNLFDTVLPTRNARHGYLYVSEGQGDVSRGYKTLKYDVLHIKTDRYKLEDKPVDENCDCECCQTVSRAYLRYLIRLQEPAGLRLATIHNLRFYARWMEALRLNSKY